MTDLDAVLTAVSAAGRPISAIDVCDITDMERDIVGKALGTLYTQGRVSREEVPNVLAGQTGQRKFMYVYTPADTATGDDLSPIAAPVGEDLSPAPVPKAKGWRNFSYGDSPKLSADERAAKAKAKTSKARQSKPDQETDGWTDEAIQAAALTHPRPRWLVTPMGTTFDSREAAVDHATSHAASEGIDFAIVRLEAIASVSVRVEWEQA